MSGRGGRRHERRTTLADLVCKCVPTWLHLPLCEFPWCCVCSNGQYRPNTHNKGPCHILVAATCSFPCKKRAFTQSKGHNYWEMSCRHHISAALCVLGWTAQGGRRALLVQMMPQCCQEWYHHSYWALRPGGGGGGLRRVRRRPRQRRWRRRQRGINVEFRSDVGLSSKTLICCV